MAQERLSSSVHDGSLLPVDAARRHTYLTRVREKYLRGARLLKPTVFLSFAGESGEKLVDQVYAAIRKTPACPFGPHFDVETGMRQSGHPEVMKHIKMHLRRSCIFLGIMTAEIPLATPEDSGGFAPGAWVLIEAGMASALDIPCVLLVEEGVHESFWKEQLGSIRHVHFSKRSLAADLGHVMLRLQEHYEAENSKGSD